MKRSLQPRATHPTPSVTDITEHPTFESKVHCAAVPDTFSRRFPSAARGAYGHDADLAALRMARSAGVGMTSG
ncbi:hypothetical protein [Streptomyces adustus]